MISAKTIENHVAPAPNVWLSLGANLGDAAATLAEALRRIDRLEGTDLRSVSHLYRSAPVGFLDQPPFLNLAASLASEIPPRELAAACREIERELGRRERPKWHEREIDIDMLIYTGYQIDTPELTLPHPRMRERSFVILPLAEIAPDLRHPITGESIREISANLHENPEEWIERLDNVVTEPERERTPGEDDNDR